MIHLRSAELVSIPSHRADNFPYSVPLFRQRPKISFDAPVTILVGENGSGKSTLIEALAIAVQARAIGSAPVEEDPSLANLRQLARSLKLIWSMRVKEGFFLRAEDFFGFVKRMDQLKVELKAEEKAISAEFADRSAFAQSQALMPFRNELANLKRIYGEGLDTMSHGESFLKLFQSRLAPNGLYLLDEPETPLSPLRQLSLIAQIKEMVTLNCQFIIATHSPILMAIPNAQIYEISSGNINVTQYDDLEHVRMTRDFLNNPQQFLRHL